MNIEYLVGALVACALFGYLIYALIWAERF